MAGRVLTPRAEDFPRWYLDVVNKAELAENGPARGTMIIKPWGYAVWERIQREMDDRIKATGHENAYFPLFIPESFLRKEAQHVEGFSPELAVVTHGGGEKLAEPLVVRPTSETVIGDAMARWIQGWRDLPLLLNQWANVVRWELRPRLFLRTTEFLWQEGHTAHATREEAQAETLLILDEVYGAVMRDVMATHTIPGLKSRRETFAGADLTYTHESLMRDGKALQMGTSHNLGQNFAKAFGIQFSDRDNALQHVWTTSWGFTTRSVGALVMAHGDDRGLRLPPRLAPVQAVVVAVKDEVLEAARVVLAGLRAAGVRARLDDRTEVSFGRRATEWELKGVPVRLELGPRDLAEGVVTVTRRDREGPDGKQALPLDGAAGAVPALLEEIQDALLADHRAFTEASTHDVDAPGEVEGSGLFRLPWGKVGDSGEDDLAARGFTVRCLVRGDGSVPATREEPDLQAYVARAY